MTDWYMELALERNCERLRAAEVARLIEQVRDQERAARPAQPGVRDRTLVRLGDWLVAVGQRLQVSGGCVPLDATEQR